MKTALSSQLSKGETFGDTASCDTYSDVHDDKVPNIGTKVNDVPKHETHVVDTIRQMAQRVSDGYAQLLNEVMKQAGKSVKELGALTGLGRTGVWRVLNAKPDATIEGAERLRATLMSLVPGANLPPPSVTIQGPRHWEWIELADELLADPELLDELIIAVRKRLKGRRLVAEAEKELGLGSQD